MQGKAREQERVSEQGGRGGGSLVPADPLGSVRTQGRASEGGRRRELVRVSAFFTIGTEDKNVSVG
jgi:hypothetical protein